MADFLEISTKLFILCSKCMKRLKVVGSGVGTVGALSGVNIIVEPHKCADNSN